MHAADIREQVREALVFHLARALPDPLRLGYGSALSFLGAPSLEADIAIWPKEISPDVLKGADVLLAIRLSAGGDDPADASIYAEQGVRELWIVDCASRRTKAHRGARDGQWASVVTHGPGDALTLAAVPAFSLKLADIGPADATGEWAETGFRLVDGLLTGALWLTRGGGR